MKIYDATLAPNPRRLRIFVAEKGLNIPYEQVDIFAGKNRTPEFLKKNPAGGLPVLELDDGTCIAESVAIARYLEALNPEPNLFGRNPREQADIEMWSRRMELSLFGPIGRAFQNTNPMFATRIKQFQDYGAAQLETAKRQLEWLDGQLASKEFIAGSRYTMADIHALTAIIFGQQTLDLRLDPALKNLTRWHQSVSGRPSAKA
ncbi:MAG TPA: glutathione S-transferase family protein [Candidatus Binataceae bacterium]|nr:glutathione S-transferase family protein [Candidatus Binataceae bacterium]